MEVGWRVTNGAHYGTTDCVLTCVVADGRLKGNMGILTFPLCALRGGPKSAMVGQHQATWTGRGEASAGDWGWKGHPNGWFFCRS